MSSFFIDLILLVLNHLFNIKNPSTTTIAPTTTSTSTILSSISQDFQFKCPYSPNTILKNECPYGFAAPYCDECGLRFSYPNAKVVGGIEAIPHSWPSMAFIYFNYTYYLNINGVNFLKTETSFCGGSLIDRKTVLTAAHCIVQEFSIEVNGKQIEINVELNEFHPTFESMYTVYLGLHDNKIIETNLQTLKVEIIKMHENYNHSLFSNDIAILKLSKSANLNCYVQIACLPDPKLTNYPSVFNTSVYASGWGSLYDMDDGPVVTGLLNNIELTLYDKSMCSKVLPDIPKDWSKQLCAGEYEGDKDTCQGDSGGPLFLLDKVNGKSKFILIGIISYGDGCAKREKPGIYTRVSAYLDWIKKNS